MANRTVMVGVTTPPVDLQVTDETFNGTAETVPDFSTAQSINVRFIGKTNEFGGDGVAKTPPISDPNGKNFWNVRYGFADTDTQNPDVYAIFVTVTDADGGVDTYPLPDTLTVKAFPTVSASSSRGTRKPIQGVRK